MERLKIPYKLKERLYPLIIILENLISYRNGVIRIETELVELRIKKQIVVISFNILLLGNNEVVLKML